MTDAVAKRKRVDEYSLARYKLRQLSSQRRWTVIM